jgi:hypothetical protein
MASFLKAKAAREGPISSKTDLCYLDTFTSHEWDSAAVFVSGSKR